MERTQQRTQSWLQNRAIRVSKLLAEAALRAKADQLLQRLKFDEAEVVTLETVFEELQKRMP